MIRIEEFSCFNRLNLQRQTKQTKIFVGKAAKEIMIRNSFCVVGKKKNYTEEKK
jgi:hypothetical protein